MGGKGAAPPPFPPPPRSSAGQTQAVAVGEGALSLRGLADGDTEPPVLSSSIQRSFLSVICSKCLRPFRGAPAVIIGGRSARFLIGSVGPYQRRIFQDL